MDYLESKKEESMLAPIIMIALGCCLLVAAFLVANKQTGHSMVGGALMFICSAFVLAVVLICVGSLVGYEHLFPHELR